MASFLAVFGAYVLLVLLPILGYMIDRNPVAW
jgi:hypothetical protein